MTTTATAAAATTVTHAVVPVTRMATSVRARAELRRQQLDERATAAMTLARTSISAAMDFLEKDRPNEFLSRSTW